MPQRKVRREITEMSLGPPCNVDRPCGFATIGSGQSPIAADQNIAFGDSHGSTSSRVPDLSACEIRAFAVNLNLSHGLVSRRFKRHVITNAGGTPSKSPKPTRSSALTERSTPSDLCWAIEPLWVVDRSGFAARMPGCQLAAECGWGSGVF